MCPGLRVLTGIPRPERWTELRAPSVAHVLTIARRLARFVVVDCGFAIEDDEELSYDTLAPRRNAATLTALESADELVVVGAADPIGLQRLVRAVQDLASVPSPGAAGRGQPGAARVRRSAPRAPDRRGARAASPGWTTSPSCPGTSRPLDAALFAGTTLAESAPQSDCAQGDRLAGRRGMPRRCQSASPTSLTAPVSSGQELNSSVRPPTV